jgi:hypothetical protein
MIMFVGGTGTAGTFPVTATSAGNITLTSTAGTIVITGVAGPGVGFNTLNFDITGGGAAVEQFQVDSGANVVPTAGVVIVHGTTASNAGTPVQTVNTAVNRYQIAVQLTTTSAITSVVDAGLASFASSQFAVDVNGRVTLLGGTGPAVQTMTVQSATAPGITTVSPISGNITVNAAAVAAHSVPIETRSRALGAYNVEVQEAAAVAASDATKSGIAHFSSADFTVDASGFVALAGTGGAAIETITGDSGGALGPTAGNFNFVGATVANGTDAKPVFFKGAGSTETLDVQVAAANSTSVLNKAGLASFNSSTFTVDSNGWVNGRGGPLIWQTITASQTLVINNGYICISPGGALPLLLPTAAAIGDIIEITLDGATSFQITQGASKQIRIGNTQTTAGAGGSITSTRPGDTIRMVAQTTNLWNVLSSIGNFIIV